MSKSHNVLFKKNDLLLLNFISSFFLSIFWNLKCYGCAKLKFTLMIRALEAKEQQKNYEKDEFVEFKILN
jgi:hypothetical protein